MASPPFAKYASPKTVLILFLLILGVNVLFFANPATPDSIALDLKFSYTPEFVMQKFDKMPENEKNTYEKTLYSLDIIYPVIYTLFLSFSLYLLFGNKTLIPLLPYFVFLFDILENTGIIMIINRYPVHDITTLARVSSVFTSLKWSFFIICIVLLFIGLARKFILKPRAL